MWTRPLAVMLISFPTFVWAAEPEAPSVTSPDGKLVLTVAGGPSPTLTVSRNGRQVFPPSPWGVTCRGGGTFPGALHLASVKREVIDETYTMPVGKRSRCRNHANQVTIDFADAEGRIRFSLVARAYDEAVAYRYHIHGQGEDTVLKEASAFRIPTGSRCWFAPYCSYYESIYGEHAGFVGAPRELQFPLLFQFPGGTWGYLTEAAVDGTYSGARVDVCDAAQGLLGLKLADLPTSTLPWTTPWRVLFVVDSLRPLVESTLINSLNPPSAIADPNWIKPGTDIFPWITGTEGGGGPCHRNNNSRLEWMKEFVDLARDMGWPWIEFDNALALGTPFGGPPEKWMDCPWFPQLTAYAASQGVSVYGWDHMCNLDTPEKRKTQLDWYVAHGFKGIKVDFLNSDVQAVYRLREDLARDCAARRLLISYHGDITPRGMQRTWPNIATHEGVLGEEYLNFGHVIPTPAYNVNLVFTRNVAGSMDYTPTGFDIPGSKVPRQTTSAHEMALAVVFESGWQSMAVNPASLPPQAPARGFLKNLPSVWDDLRFIDGAPDEFAVVARRKGRDWWVAGISAGTRREVRLDLGFLAPGEYACTLYHDAPTPEGAAVAPLETRVAADPVTIRADRPLVVDLPPNGGFGLRVANGARD